MKAEFYLKNLNTSLSSTFKFGNSEIQIASNDDHIKEMANFLSEGNPTLETGILRIDGLTDQEENLKLAQTIRHLMSLALGRNIIFDRQVFKDYNEESQVFRKMSDPINEGVQIVPEFCIDEYLIKTIPNWQSQSKDEEKALFVAINYLNQTKNSYIEDRILKVSQAWESLAEFWKIESDLDDRLLQLNNQLRDAYKKWREENDVSDIDDSGHIGSKISSSINQEKLLSKLEGLATRFRLNKSKLNLKFKELKSLRDQVAHTGRINISGKEAYPILESALKGLQIIILDHLGYDGLVIYHKDGWRTFEKMEEFKAKHNENYHP
jgi:hypothetical protein